MKPLVQIKLDVRRETLLGDKVTEKGFDEIKAGYVTEFTHILNEAFYIEFEREIDIVITLHESDTEIWSFGLNDSDKELLPELVTDFSEATINSILLGEAGGEAIE